MWFGRPVSTDAAGSDNESNLRITKVRTVKCLHTACRDLFSISPAEPEATDQARGELAKLAVFLEEIDSGKITNAKGEQFTSMIHVGIGGSDLGPRSIYEALRPYGQVGREVFFISNVDPDDAFAVLAKVDLSTTLVNIVSKSGTTLETLTNEKDSS